MISSARKQPIAERRLRKLLARGYFPSELPPPFTTETFALHADSFAKKWQGSEIRGYWTAPEAYSIARYGDARRKLSIVNPINQLHVAQLISDNWSKLRKKLNRSKITEFKPNFSLSNNGRAITGVDFDGVSRQRARLLATYGRYVKTDIARFYPSIYTHSIAWSIVGKAHAKASHSSKVFKESYPNHLDKAVGAGQEGQTIGIPIGPDTSRIISELVIVEIEEIVKKHIHDFENRSVRYVDDFLIGLNENETAATALSGLSLALYDYQLELNAEKTNTFGLGCDHAPEWIHYVRTFLFNTRTSRQRDDLDSFFEQAVYLADHNKRDNALLFAVKRAASFAVDKTNIDHLVRWMLYSARRSATCLSFVAEYLAATNATTALPVDEIYAYIIEQIPVKAAVGHTDELAWLLFWAREIKLSIPSAILANVVGLRSSVVGLLTLDLWHNGLITGALDFSFWQSFATEIGLKSEMWLISYEATQKKWWPKPQSDDFITQHKFFGDLAASKVEFYEAGRKARRRIQHSPFGKKSAANSDPGSFGYPI